MERTAYEIIGGELKMLGSKQDGGQADASDTKPAPPAKPDSPTKPTANQYAQASQGAGRAPSNQTLAVDDLDDDIPF